MRKLTLAVLIVCVAFAASGYSFHKFYVSIYKIEYNQPKKRLEITARIFVDDLNAALLQKYHIETRIGDNAETPGDMELMKKYFLSNFTITIDQRPAEIFLLSHELENNVVICYFKAGDVTKFKSADIRNTALFDLAADQQNIIQMNISKQKQSLLLTVGNPSGTLTW